MRIGDKILVRGTIDEIRKDVVIIRNKGGYFETVPEEIRTLKTLTGRYLTTVQGVEDEYTLYPTEQERLLEG